MGVRDGEGKGWLTPSCNSGALGYRPDWSLANGPSTLAVGVVVPMEPEGRGGGGQTRLFIKNRRLGGKALERVPFEVPSDLFQPITVCFSSQDHM